MNTFVANSDVKSQSTLLSTKMNQVNQIQTK